MLDQRTQHGDRLVDSGGAQADRGEGRDADRGGVGIVGLASVSGGQHPDAGGDQVDFAAADLPGSSEHFGPGRADIVGVVMR